MTTPANPGFSPIGTPCQVTFHLWPEIFHGGGGRRVFEKFLTTLV